VLFLQKWPSIISTRNQVALMYFRNSIKDMVTLRQIIDIFFCYNPSTMDAIFKRIRNSGNYPSSVGPYKVKNIRDLTTGYDNSKPNNKAILPISSSTHMITFFFENGTIATLRGSGTEPKLKYYCELNGENVDAVQSTLTDVVQHIITELLEPEKNNLEKPSE